MDENQEIVNVYKYDKCSLINVNSEGKNVLSFRSVYIYP